MGRLGIGFDLAGAEARRGFDFARVLPPGASLARASAATRFDATGVMVTEAVDVARFDHDPVSKAPLGLLIEPARTNLVLRSQAIDDASWGKVGVTAGADQAVAPDGTMTADLLTANQASGYFYTAVSLAAATPFAFSAYLRSAGTVASLYQEMVSGGGTAYAGGPVTVTTTANWVRLSVVGNTAAQPAPFWAAFGGDFTFSTGEAFLLWGAQVEVGSAATSYIPTAGATASRAADVLTLNWASRGIADGNATVRYTFDDGTTQDVATTIAGGTATVPSTLNRRWLRRADKL